MMGAGDIPVEVRRGLDKARKLCLWTLFWISDITILMYLAMGQSRAMKTAFIEDILSLVPSIVFLISASVENKKADRRCPLGYERFRPRPRKGGANRYTDHRACPMGARVRSVRRWRIAKKAPRDDIVTRSA